MAEPKSKTPRQDYLNITREFITALQTHVRLFEDHEQIFDREVLESAYRTQAAMVQQHFSVISVLYDREFVANEPDPTVEPIKESSIILL